ncbi:MAG: heavy-metal-associated domain-containing protein [Oligoflexus sp.]
MKISSVIISTALALSSLNGIAEGKTKTCEYKVTGMTCAACSTTLKIGVKRLGGINSVEASSDKGNAVVSFDPEITDESKVKAAIEKVGYKATLTQCKA